MSTPDYGIPTISQTQEAPELTINKALFMLQMLSGIGIIGVVNAPSGTPNEGDCYVVGGAASFEWAGKDHCIAGYFNGEWLFVPGLDSSGVQIAPGPRHEGMSVWRRTTDLVYRWNGTGWV